jgi:hypothetical protein
VHEWRPDPGAASRERPVPVYAVLAAKRAERNAPGKTRDRSI